MVVAVDLVVPEDFQILPEFTKILDQVIGEGIVVIDHQKHNI